MRTYTSFILFEEVLDFAPQSDAKLYQFIQDITNPKARVVSTNCGTTVGMTIPITYEIEGLIELATDNVINKARIDTILATGTYSVAVRDLYTCVVPNGICSRCFQGTYIDAVAPKVNDVVRLVPEYNFQTDVFVGNGGQTTFPLSQVSTDYEKALVIIDGVIQLSGYSIVNNQLVMTVAPIVGKHVVVKYYHITSQPFVGWLAQTYSGALLGMQPLPAQPLHFRPSLGQSLFTDEELNIMFQQLHNYPLIPSDSLEYTNNIHDRLEKAVYIGMLYGIFSNGS